MTTQVERLRAGDFAAAFASNSEANRARLGDVAKFEAIVRSSASFAALASPHAPYTCVERTAAPLADAATANRPKPSTTVVEVHVEAAPAPLLFAFDVSGAPGGGCATEGVRIVC